MGVRSLLRQNLRRCFLPLLGRTVPIPNGGRALASARYVTTYVDDMTLEAAHSSAGRVQCLIAGATDHAVQSWLSAQQERQRLMT